MARFLLQRVISSFLSIIGATLIIFLLVKRFWWHLHIAFFKVEILLSSNLTTLSFKYRL